MLYVTPPSPIGYGPATAASTPYATAREAGALKEYEQLFIFQMLKEMRKTIPADGVIDGGSQKAYFDEMLDDFLAGEMAASGQFGIARQMAGQIHASRTVPNPGAPEAGTPPGLPLHVPHTGIGTDRRAAPGLPLKRAPGGIPVGGAAGIPVHRVLERYRLDD